MIAGLEEVTAGEVRIGDADVTDLAPRHRDIAMVFQNYALYPHMTGPRTSATASRCGGRRKAETRRRVEEVAGLLGLGDLLERKPAQLSGGQRQRVAMGRAIVREPQAFLMDEPLSNLDAKLRVAMRASLAQLHAKLGVTTIYVTHDQTEAMTLGQRVAVMRDGRIVQFDEPQALYRRPENVFVAAFIGSPSMNLVEAAIEGSSVRFGQFAVPLDAENRPARTWARSCSGSGRRRSRTATPPRPALPRLTAQVDVLEELGAETHICFPVDAKRVSVERAATTPRTTPRCSPSTRRSSRHGWMRARARHRATSRASLSIRPASTSSIRSRARASQPPTHRRERASSPSSGLDQEQGTLRWREVPSRGRR